MGSRNYCFTLHFSSEALAIAAALDELPEHVGYLFYTVQRGDTQVAPACHWQGYLELDKVMRIGPALKGLHPLFSKMHFEPRKAPTAEEAIAYCRDSTTNLDYDPVELGRRGHQGKKRKSPLDEATEAIMANPMITQRELDLQFPSATVRYNRQLIDFRQRLRMQVKDDSAFVPNDWQQSIIDRIKIPADDRHVIWVTDSVGGKGKSRLARHLIAQYDACLLSGKELDMKYAWKNHLGKIAIFDITRAAAEFTDHLYTMGENLKNGNYCSAKYESCMVPFEAPHVIYFANFGWDRSKFSLDRVIDIDLDKWVSIPPLPVLPDEPILLDENEAFLERFFTS